MEPHFPIISGVSTSGGGKDYQEDMAVKIDDFNKVIREKSKKFHGSYQVRRSFYAIFDGHGGARCSKFLAENFHILLAKHMLVGERPVEALEHSRPPPAPVHRCRTPWRQMVVIAARAR